MNSHPSARWKQDGRERPRVVVLAAPNRPRVDSELPTILRCIEKHAEILAVDKEFKYDLESCDADLVVVLGGDGSILQSARQMR